MKWILIFVLSTWVSFSHAGLMDPVLVDGREWLQPKDFNTVSWREISTACTDGVCGAGSVQGHNIAGWNWATREDVIALFEATTPYVHSEGSILEVPSDSAWATEFFDVLGFEPTIDRTGEFDYRYIRAIVSTRLEAPLHNRAVISLLYDGRMPSLPDQVAIRESQYEDERFNGVGAWFYREAAQIPVTGVLPLVILALTLLHIQLASSKGRVITQATRTSKPLRGFAAGA